MESDTWATEPERLVSLTGEYVESRLAQQDD